MNRVGRHAALLKPRFWPTIEESHYELEALYESDSDMGVSCEALVGHLREEERAWQAAEE